VAEVTIEREAPQVPDIVNDELALSLGRALLRVIVEHLPRRESAPIPLEPPVPDPLEGRITISLSEAVQLSGRSRTWWFEARRNGSVKAVKVGGIEMIPTSELRRIQQQGTRTRRKASRPPLRRTNELHSGDERSPTQHDLALLFEQV